MKVEPYVNFNGVCEEAIEFYKSALGAKVNRLMRFKDSPEPCPDTDASKANKVMHASITIGDSTVNLSDGRCTAGAKFEGVSLTISVANDTEAERTFNALAAGGNVTMPLTKTFFSSKFGMLADKFGMTWMVIVAH
jgi:PhnB protein